MNILLYNQMDKFNSIKGKGEIIMLPRALNEVIFTYIAIIQLTITRRERAWFPFQALPFPVNQVKLR